MQSTSIRMHTVVLPGGKIELSAPPSMREGDEVDVVVVATSRPAATSVLEVLDALPKDVGQLKSADEVDRYVRSERDSWER
jgi:hypothetical protein